MNGVALQHLRRPLTEVRREPEPGTYAAPELDVADAGQVSWPRFGPDRRQPTASGGVARVTSTGANRMELVMLLRQTLAVPVAPRAALHRNIGRFGPYQSVEPAQTGGR
jgi:hypothetical protein